MYEIRSKNGFKAYVCSAKETKLIGGCGVCDCCNERVSAGFLVPVMDYYMCPECFFNFDRNYPKNLGSDELAYEFKKSRFYESHIPIDAYEDECAYGFPLDDPYYKYLELWLDEKLKNNLFYLKEKSIEE